MTAANALSLTQAERVCVLCSGLFFMTALLSGIWKWRQMAASKTGTAHKYVDTAHRASLMYSFAALLLGKFSALNDFTEETNYWAVLGPLAFFGFAIGTYLIHGALGDTTNQIHKPRLGRVVLPSWMTPLFMVLLIVAEVGGFAVLMFGFVRVVYF